MQKRRLLFPLPLKWQPLNLPLTTGEVNFITLLLLFTLPVSGVAVPTVQTPSVPTVTAPSQAFEDDDDEYLTVDSFEESAAI